MTIKESDFLAMLQHECIRVVRVLYPGYRGTPVIAQPRNLARDTHGLPAAVPGVLQYWDCRYPDDQHSIEYPSPGAPHPPERRHCPMQRWDKIAPRRTNSKKLSGQVKPTPHSTDSKNLLECHPPQCQEQSGAKKNISEALSNFYEPTFSSLGPTGHVNLPPGCKSN
jgi:hypothetical protein